MNGAIFVSIGRPAEDSFAAALSAAGVTVEWADGVARDFGPEAAAAFLLALAAGRITKAAVDALAFDDDLRAVTLLGIARWRAGLARKAGAL